MTSDQLATIKGKVNGTPSLLLLWDAGTPVPIADALNDPGGIDAGTVTPASTPKADLLVALRPALLTLPAKDAATQAKWSEVKADIRAVDHILIDATAIALFASAVSDGVLTSQQATACYQRQGSWAEVQFGAGVALSWQDVVAAMNA